MPTTYRKTAKGQAEIETRQYRLNPRLRTALILVDGHRSDTDLRRMIFGEADETLRTLLDEGFIEPIADRRSSGAPTTVSPPINSAPAPFGSTAPAPFGSSTAAPFASSTPQPLTETQVLTGKAFEQFRRDAIRSFTDTVGPMAEALAIKMEKARSHDDLRPLLGLAMNIILNTRGAKVAGDFSARFLQ